MLASIPPLLGVEVLPLAAAVRRRRLWSYSVLPFCPSCRSSLVSQRAHMEARVSPAPPRALHRRCLMFIVIGISVIMRMYALFACIPSPFLFLLRILRLLDMTHPVTCRTLPLLRNRRANLQVSVLVVWSMEAECRCAGIVCVCVTSLHYRHYCVSCCVLYEGLVCYACACYVACLRNLSVTLRK